MISNPEAEAHYQRAIMLRKQGNARALLAEIEQAIAFEHQPEYYFERAWAQLVLEEVEEAEKSLEIIGAIIASRPSARVHPDHVAWLWQELALLNGRLKQRTALFLQAVEDEDPEAILAALTPGQENNLIDFMRPSLRLTGSGTNGAMSQSKLGGQPDMPSDFEWPEGHDGVPLAFLCQLNLTTLNVPKPSPLPSSGMLYFFYEANEQPWGFEPEDKGQWKVIYNRQTTGLWAADIPEELPDGSAFPPLFLKGEHELTLPDWNHERISKFGLTQPTRDCYMDAIERWYGKEPWHRFLGNPQPIQGAMEIECEMLANGINPATGYNHAKFASIASGAQKWRLLLQLDSDTDTGMTWGDGGRLYFWIRQEDLKLRNFDDVWLMLQCY